MHEIILVCDELFLIAYGIEHCSPNSLQDFLSVCKTVWVAETMYWSFDKLCENEAPLRQPFKKYYIYMKTLTKIKK